MSVEIKSMGEMKNLGGMNNEERSPSQAQGGNKPIKSTEEGLFR